MVYDTRKKKWSCPHSLQKLADILLAPRDCALILDASAYYVATAAQCKEVYEQDLSRQIGRKNINSLKRMIYNII